MLFFILLLISTAVCAFVVYLDVRSTGLNNDLAGVTETNPLFQNKTGVGHSDLSKLKTLNGIALVAVFAAAIAVYTFFGELGVIPALLPLLWAAVRTPVVVNNYKIHKQAAMRMKQIEAQKQADDDAVLSQIQETN